jgi:hypothetical protein
MTATEETSFLDIVKMPPFGAFPMHLCVRLPGSAGAVARAGGFGGRYSDGPLIGIAGIEDEPGAVSAGIGIRPFGIVAFR